MEEATPKKLFVCTCKAKLSYAEALGKFLAEGIPLSSELQDVTIKHVRHCQDLVERGKLWLGGPLPDLSMALNIFVVDSAEEARELQRNDPYSAFGLFYDDKYSEWFIHFPLRKSSPAHREPVEGLLRQAGIEPESLINSKGVENMEEATPKKLFVRTSKAKLSYAEALDKFLAEGIPLSSELQDVTIKHVRYCQDLVERGKLWLGGPLPDLSMALNIFAVDSAEEARELQRNDPYSAFGLFYDDKYSEWFIHFPLRKSSPAHREPVEGLLRQAGIEPESL